MQFETDDVFVLFNYFDYDINVPLMKLIAYQFVYKEKLSKYGQ